MLHHVSLGVGVAHHAGEQWVSASRGCAHVVDRSALHRAGECLPALGDATETVEFAGVHGVLEVDCHVQGELRVEEILQGVATVVGEAHEVQLRVILQGQNLLYPCMLAGLSS